MVPSTPRSLVKFAARLSSVSTGAFQLDPDERPRSARDVPEVRAGRGTPTTAEAVSCEPDGGEQRLLVRPRLLAHGRRQRRQDLPAGTISGSSPAGRPSASTSSGAHCPVRASRRPVVEAIRLLGGSRPVSQ